MFTITIFLFINVFKYFYSSTICYLKVWTRKYEWKTTVYGLSERDNIWSN